VRFLDARVLEVGGSAVFPEPDVMRFAVFGGAVAAGGGAVAVACDEGVTLGGGDGAGEAPDVEDFAGPVGEDAADFGVAAEPFEGGG